MNSCRCPLVRLSAVSHFNHLLSSEVLVSCIIGYVSTKVPTSSLSKPLALEGREERDRREVKLKLTLKDSREERPTLWALILVFKYNNTILTVAVGLDFWNI